MREEVLRLENVTRIADGVTLLEDVNLQIFQGEIMGLICINYGGQDELLELLQKNIPIHYGRVYFNEKLVNSYEQTSSSMNKISIIERHSRLADDLRVADNIFVLRHGFRKYLINRKKLNAQLRQFTDELDLNLDGDRLVARLTPYEKYACELLRAVVAGVKLVVIKDISNCVGTADLIRFQELMKHFAAKGFSFLYVCNHHEEAFKICDRLALMENGRIIKVLDKRDFTRHKMNPYYIGVYPGMPLVQRLKQENVLRFESVSTGHLHNASFSVDKGECVVLLDMNNTVLSDIIMAMKGVLPVDSGRIFLKGKPYTRKKARRAIENGVAFIGQYPTSSMLFPDMDYMKNLCFLIDQKRNIFRMNGRIRKSVIQEYGDLLGDDIFAKDITRLGPVSLYNLIYYRIHLFNPGVVFCVQPFSDADLNLRRHVVDLILLLKKKGIAVIILAVNLSDSLIVADRLLQVKEGILCREFEKNEFKYFDREATIL